ncbi:MAG TPA: ABC transporter ATP-binding protein [Opitutaceae bacterium]|nr:ABC transporter ATP-binding protein [Opitutaceae bacterium]
MPADTVISVSGLSKRYRLGHVARHDTLRDALGHKLRRLARLGREDPGRGSREEFWALREVSFEVRRGEVIGIIGRNGAGKSTLLKIISRITEPTAGLIELRGRVASLLEVGTGFHPELSGRENVFLNGAILGMSRGEIRRKFDEIVAFAEVEKFLDTPVKHYSSGMYVRLAFAVAAHLEPEILVVDEVLAVGDYAFQRKCLGKMSAVASDEGRTVLFVSHNLGSVTGLCSRALWLADGRLNASGPAAAVVADYIRSQTEQTRTAFDFRDRGGPERAAGRLVLTGLELNQAGAILHRESFRARIHFRTNAPVDGVAFGLGFCSVEGTRLATIDSDLDGQRRSYPAGHAGWIEVALPELQLGPGRYALDLGARCGDVASLDYLPSCGMIEVQPGPRTSAGAVQIPGGGLRLSARWQESSEASA